MRKHKVAIQAHDQASSLLTIAHELDTISQKIGDDDVRKKAVDEIKKIIKVSKKMSELSSDLATNR